MHFPEECARILRQSRDCSFPGVAKFGIALEWGSRGPEFESRHSDHENRKSICSFGFRFFMGDSNNAMQLSGGQLLADGLTTASILIPEGNQNAENLGTQTKNSGFYLKCGRNRNFFIFRNLEQFYKKFCYYQSITNVR